MSAAVQDFGTVAGIVPVAQAGNANAARIRGGVAKENNVSQAVLHHPDVGLNPELQAAEAWFNAQLAKARATGRFAEFCRMTPAIAQVILMRNDDNRAVVANGVRKWASALRAGRWEENGETIIVASCGYLNDGQHRLLAVIETGIVLNTLVVFGVSRQSRMTVDGGTKRTAGHILGMNGVKQGQLTAAAMKFLLNLEGGVGLNTYRQAFEIKAGLERHPDILEGCHPATSAAREYRQSTGLFVALHYLMATRDPGKAKRFFEMVYNGLGIVDKAHPVARLRARLLANVAGKAKLPPIEVAAITIKAWNAYVQGRNVDALRWRAAGDTPESFPQVQA